MSSYSDTRQRQSRKYREKHAQLLREVAEAEAYLIRKNIIVPPATKQERHRADSEHFRAKGEIDERHLQR